MKKTNRLFSCVLMSETGLSFRLKEAPAEDILPRGNTRERGT